MTKARPVITKHPKPHTHKVTILAQDPSAPIFAEVDVPYETPIPGPCGYRVRVIDYDSSTGKLYRPGHFPIEPEGGKAHRLLADRAFHAQNVYAIVMRTLARFEFALGRRVPWSFDGHQLFVAPHGFADANAFYSKRDRALFFGYFTGTSGKSVFTCLAHDVVAHETTHALVDGLRERFTDPSSPDQAAFHEGIADAVALLSIFSIAEVVKYGLDSLSRGAGSRAGVVAKLVEKKALTITKLKDTVLLGLGKQVGEQMQGFDITETNRRKVALRRSVAIKPDKNILNLDEFKEPHRRGEVFVAAVMNVFLNIWHARLRQLGTVRDGMVDRDRVAEDGATAADHLLTVAIRALDYCPATDLSFCDYLSALLTADYEIQPDDSRYHYRNLLLEGFAAYGIEPSSKAPGGRWENPDDVLDNSWTHFESLRRDRDEVFRFLWQNQVPLGINSEAYTRILSVRPCTRISPDGFTLSETVAEYVQMMTLTAKELPGLQWEIWKGLDAERKSQLKPFPIPQGMTPDLEITIYGGGSLIFNEFGRLKYHIRNKILNADRQAARLDYLWKSGFFDEPDSDNATPFASMHRLRWADDASFFGKETPHGEFF